MIARMLPILCLLLGFSSFSGAQLPSLSAPLPELKIADKGQLISTEDDYNYAPWSSQDSPGKVHILQYFAGTKSDQKTFEPFTNLLQNELDYADFHVTTIVNLDAALWGTSGFVISEVKSKKDEFPQATIVLDEDGLGAETWELGKKGALLVVMDCQGVVRFLTREKMSEATMADTLQLILTHIDS